MNPIIKERVEKLWIKLDIDNLEISKYDKKHVREHAEEIREFLIKLRTITCFTSTATGFIGGMELPYELTKAIDKIFKTLYNRRYEGVYIKTDDKIKFLITYTEEVYDVIDYLHEIDKLLYPFMEAIK